MSHACPICAAALEPQSRYPRYVCSDCADRACSADGRPLTFSNVGCRLRSYFNIQQGKRAHAHLAGKNQQLRKLLGN